MNSCHVIFEANHAKLYIYGCTTLMQVQISVSHTLHFKLHRTYGYNKVHIEFTSCRIYKLGVPNRPASLQKTRPNRRRCDNARLPSWSRYIMTGQGIDPVPDRKAWPKCGHSPTPTSFFDRGYAGLLLMILPRPTHSRAQLGTTNRGRPLGEGPGIRESR